MAEQWGFQWAVSIEADRDCGDRVRGLAEEIMRDQAAASGKALGDIRRSDRIEMVVLDEGAEDADDFFRHLVTHVPIDRARQLGFQVEGRPRYFLDRFAADVVGNC